MFTVGTGIGITVGAITESVEHKTVTYDSAKGKSTLFTFFPGIGATIGKTCVTGLELGLVSNTSETDKYIWIPVANKAEKVSTKKEIHSAILARVGAETYVIEDILAIRLGAVKIIFSSGDTETKDETTKKIDKRTDSMYGGVPYLTGAYFDYFSAGLAFKVSEKITLEYGLIDSFGLALTKHQILAKVTF